MKVILSLLLTIVYLGISNAQEGELKFDDGKFVVTWTLSDDEKSIFFKINAQSAGWIALGFSLTGNQMVDADIIIGQVDATNTTKLQIGDFFSTQNGRPTQDATLNIDEREGWRDTTKGTAYMEFRRLLSTGDTTTQDKIIPLDGIYILWSRSDVGTIAEGAHVVAGVSDGVVKFTGNDGNYGARISLFAAPLIVLTHFVARMLV